MFFKNFSSEAFVIWLSRELNRILWLMAFISFTIVAFLIWNQYQNTENKKLENALYVQQAALKQLIEKSEPVQKEPDKENPFQDIPDQKPKIFSKPMKEQASSYARLIKAHPGRVSAASFAGDLADFYWQREERAEAIDLLLPFAQAKKSLNIYHLLSFQLASYYMDEKKCEAAIPLLSALITNEKARFLHLESRLQKAICLEHLKRREAALHEYESIIHQDSGYLGRVAQDYKRLLILKNQLKEKK